MDAQQEQALSSAALLFSAWPSESAHTHTHTYRSGVQNLLSSWQQSMRSMLLLRAPRHFARAIPGPLARPKTPHSRISWQQSMHSDAAIESSEALLPELFRGPLQGPKLLSRGSTMSKWSQRLRSHRSCTDIGKAALSSSNAMRFLSVTSCGHLYR